MSLRQSDSRYPAVELMGFSKLVDAWFEMNGRSSDEISGEDFGRIEQMVGEEAFDLIADEVGRLTGNAGEASR